MLKSQETTTEKSVQSTQDGTTAVSLCNFLNKNYDTPYNFKKSLDEMFDAFIHSEFSDPNDLRKEVLFHYRCLCEVLSDENCLISKTA